jgi:GT2 family glycosyltransferase
MTKEKVGKASIIIVTYNNLNYSKLCIQGIISKTGYPDYEIIVVDNNSTDGTPDYLKGLQSEFPFIKAILNGENYGFAKANNQGIKASTGDYVVLLNNDTVVTSGWLAGVVGYLEKYPDIGLIGPVTNNCWNEAEIYLKYNGLEEMDAAAHEYTSTRKGSIFDIRMLALYCAAMRREVLEEVGLLDESFEVGMFEDDDYSHRVRLAGYRLVCAEDIFIHHYGQLSFNKLVATGEYNYIFEKNRKTFERKWNTRWIPSKYHVRLKEMEGLIAELDRKLEETQQALKDIHSSNFWKYACLYYKIRDHTPVIREVYKTLRVLKNEGPAGLVLRLKNRARRILYARAHRSELERILKMKAGKVKDIMIFPTLNDWNIPLFQRPQQLSIQLSRLGYLVFYCTRNSTHDDIDGFLPLRENLYITNREDLVLDRLSGKWIFAYSTDFSLTIQKMEEWKKRGHRIIYEYVDDISPEISGRGVDPLRERHELLNDTLVDLVLAVSTVLYDEMKIRFPGKTILHPNAVDYDHFHLERDMDECPEKLKAAATEGKPVIGYYGALANWIDYGLISVIAESRPHWTIVLIGQDYDGSMSRLRNPGNIKYLGVKHYDELPKYAIWFDVAIIPFKKGDIAKATSPIKLYEYMAMNKPVVVTEDLVECAKSEGVLFGRDGMDFVEKIEEALRLKDDPQYLTLLDEQARNNTWESRARVIDDHITNSGDTME